MTEELSKRMDDYVRALRGCVENELVRVIEQIEGRVPSNQEVAIHGLRVTTQGSSLEEYYWRKVPIMEVTYWPSFTIKSIAKNE